MKTLFITILTLLSMNLFAQNRVLETSFGMELTEAHVAGNIQFLEFMVEKPLTEAEKERVTAEVRQDFLNHPFQTLQENAQLSQFFQAVRQTTDINRIALARNTMRTEIFKIAANLSQLNYSMQLMEQYAPVVAYDAYNHAVLTQNDVNGTITYLEFVNSLMPQPESFTDTKRQQLQAEILQQFNEGTVEQKQGLIVMNTYLTVLQANWAQMTAEQKTAFKEQLYAQSGITSNQPNQEIEHITQTETSSPDQTNTNDIQADPKYEHLTKEQKLAILYQRLNGNASAANTLNNVMLDQHTAVMNMGETFGETGNYWEVVDYGY